MALVEKTLRTTSLLASGTKMNIIKFILYLSIFDLNIFHQKLFFLNHIDMFNQ